MICYALRCEADHSFDSWFQSAGAFDALALSGHVVCPVCASSRVGKSLMAPAVKAARGEDDAKPVPDRAAAAAAALAALRKRVEENSDYVGMNFVTEVRAMHEGTLPERAIHGEARVDEARRMIEEGIPVAPLPFIPARRMN